MPGTLLYLQIFQPYNPLLWHKLLHHMKKLFIIILLTFILQKCRETSSLRLENAMETKIIFINDELISHKKELESCRKEINELLAKFEEMELDPANKSYVRMMAAKINITMHDIDSNIRKISFAYNIAEQYAERLINYSYMKNTLLTNDAEDESPDTKHSQN